MSWVLALVILFGVGQMPDAELPAPEDVLNAAIYKDAARPQLAAQYRYLEHETKIIEHNTRDSTWSKAYEIICLDGVQYRRELKSDKWVPQPQEVEDPAVSDSHLRERIDTSIAQDQRLAEAFIMSGRLPQVRLSDLRKDFDIRLMKSEKLNGRQNYVLEARPRSDCGNIGPENHTCDFKFEIWVDEQDKQIRKLRANAVREGIIGHALYLRENPEMYRNATEIEKEVSRSWERFSRGTVVQMEWAKINNEVWLPVKVHIKGSFLEPHYVDPLTKGTQLGDGSIEIPFRYDVLYSDYQKFRVTHRLIPSDRKPAVPSGK